MSWYNGDMSRRHSEAARPLFDIISDGRERRNRAAGVVDIKISALEKWILALTAVFLVGTAGYFAGLRSGAEPYRVDVEYLEQTVEATLPPAESSGLSPEGKINLNTATAEELEMLPGIGEVRARAIVADREANGPFRIVEDLTRVKGIGEGTLAGLMDYATVE